MRRTLIMAMALWTLPALAGPPETSVDLRPGADTFIRAAGVAAVGVGDRSIATAEWFPSGELLISAKSPGETDVAVLAGGKIAGIHVRVAADNSAPSVSPPGPTPELHAACPGLKIEGSGGQASLVATVNDEGCRKALSKVFTTQAWTLKQTDLTYSIEALQVQLQAFESALKGASVPVTVKYQGATLVLTGAPTQAQADQMVIAIYQQAVGGLPVDDSDLLIATPDGGGEAPSEIAHPAPHTSKPGPAAKPARPAGDAGAR
jgi:hypothetical protein